MDSAIDFCKVSWVNTAIVVCGLYGLASYLPSLYPEPKPIKMVVAKPKQATNRKRKAAGRTTRAAKREKPTKAAKKKPWAVAPPLSPESQARIDEYRRRRDGITYSGAWQSGFVPL